MKKNGDWAKELTPQLKANMRESIKESFNNGESLLEDAEILFKNKRYSRSAALAILSEEEFSKSFILTICLGQGRWDSNIYKALKTHSSKQGISEAVIAHYRWATDNIKKVDAINKVSFLNHEPAVIPDEKKLNELKDIVSSRFKKPIKDHKKQNSFYVSVDKNAKILSTPSDISELDALQTNKEAKDIMSVTKLLMHDINL